MRNALRNLAAKAAIVGSLICGSVPAHAGIPVFDGVGLVQDILGYVETIMQTIQEYTSYAQQVESYATQVQQYENQVKNTLGAYTTMYSNITGFVDSLGKFENFFDGFHDLAYYKSAASSLTSGAKMVDASIKKGSDTSKKVGDLAGKTIQKVQDTMGADADAIAQVEGASSGAEGQVQAQQYGNQLAAQQATQILKLRQEMATYNNALIARQAADADKQAAMDAATQRSVDYTITASSGKEY